MTLTAADVRAKQFATVRFREGYRLEDVDAFLDEVEIEMARMAAELADLRARLANALRTQPPPVPGNALALLPPPAGAVVVPAAGAAALGSPRDAEQVLQLAQRTADARVAEAQQQAQAILDAANAAAAQATIDAAAQRSELERRIGELRTFEREYRSRLRSFIEGQLTDLDSESGPVTGQPAAAAVTAPLPTALSWRPPDSTAPIPPVSAVPRAPALPPPSAFVSPYTLTEAGEPDSPPRQAD